MKGEGEKKVRQEFSRWFVWPPLITFGIIFLIYFVTTWLRLHPDFGWHLKSGQYILAHGVPKTDIFTYSAASFPWVNHEWLGDVILSIIYSFGGYLLVSLFYAALWTLAAWLVGRKVSSAIILLATIAMAPFAGVAAITWSVLGLAILINLVNSKTRHLKLLIPLLFLVWANIHGSFVIGFVYLGYHAIKRYSWRLGVILALSFILTFLNPYGAELYTEIIRTVGDTTLKYNIGEWGSLQIPLMTLPFVILWLVVFFATGYRDWRKYLGFDVLLLFAGLNGMRALVLFVLVSIAITDERLKIVLKKAIKKLNIKQSRWFWLAGLVAILCVLGAVFVEAHDTPIDREYYYPVNAAAYLKARPCQGNLFNHYDYGGYLIWKLPGKKVYIDGRMPSWEYQGRNYFVEYINIYENNIERARQFTKYNIRCVIAMRDNSKVGIIPDLIKQKWTIAAEDHNSLLLLHP